MSVTKPLRVALLYAEVGVVDLERRDYVENGLGMKKKMSASNRPP